MKKIWITKRLLVMACVALCGVFLNCGDAFAHEMYYINNTPVGVRWNDVTNRVAKLKMNGDYLQSRHSQFYSTTKSIWNASARVSITQVSFDLSNIDLATGTQAFWNEVAGPYTYGFSELYSTDGKIVNKNTIKSSSRKIKGANLYYSPEYARYQDQIKAVMIHEVGHALGLGHPNDSMYGYNVMDIDSVMRIDADREYINLPSHDTNDLNNMY